jgi:hypothetical protein
MFKTDNEGYSFSIDKELIGFEYLEDGHIELYEKEDPGHTGFVFGSLKHFISFVNNLADIAEHLLEQEEKKSEA